MPKIVEISALEILDSRGRPTVKAYCTLSNGVSSSASVPSGASTGRAEAHELRDKNSDRYGGLGCFQAIQNIREVIAPSLQGRDLLTQAEMDEVLLALDGTKNKSSLGANALLAVSIAYARTLAQHQKIPLYQYFANQVGHQVERLPRLTINLFSGGKHAGAQVPIQDILVVPLSAPTVREGLHHTWQVYQSAVKIAKEKYNMRWLTADEGGLAPSFSSLQELFTTTVDAIEKSRYIPGQDLAIAMDVAASHFYCENTYFLGSESLTGMEMSERLKSWVDDYPIISVEDGLAEEDWEHWPYLKSSIEGKALVLGDDLLCTNTERIQKAIEKNAANALLLKVNQAGTLTEAAQALKLARSAGWQVTISARSGETEDDWLADLAVGWGGDQIKVGSITQSERLAKYNRLLEIEANTGLPVKEWH